MRHITKVLILILAVAAIPFGVMGQKHYEGPGNWFVGIDAGVSLAMNENVTAENFYHTEIPSGSIVLGRTITPYFGLRLSAGVYSQLGHPHEKAVKFDPETYDDYLFYAGSGSLDLMLNFANWFRRYDVRNWFDAYLILGGGMLYKFGLDKKVDEWPGYVYPVDSQDKWFWNAKAGLMGAWHVSRACDFTAEIDCFFTDDAYNGVMSKTSNKIDVFLSPRVGIVYYFKNSKGRHRYANITKNRHIYWKD